MTINFTIPIEPKGQKRARITTIKGRIRNFKHKDQAQYGDNIAGLIKNIFQMNPWREH